MRYKRTPPKKGRQELPARASITQRQGKRAQFSACSLQKGGEKRKDRMKLLKAKKAAARNKPAATTKNPKGRSQ